MIISSLGLFNLALMIVTLGLVLLGFYVKRYVRRTTLHAAIMTAAWALTVASVLLIMVPSLSVVLQNDLEAVGWRFQFLIIHHIFGLLPLGMAAVLAVSWLLRGRKPDSCLGRPRYKRLIMRATFSLWVLSLIMGIALYLAFL